LHSCGIISNGLKYEKGWYMNKSSLQELNHWNKGKSILKSLCPGLVEALQEKVAGLN
jgi:hypothetical protein